jgi:acetyl esterase
MGRVGVDPEFIDVLAVFPPLQFADPAAQRAAFAGMPAQELPPWPDTVRRDDRGVPAGSRSIPIRRYVPDAATREGTVVWIHGGGYCVGTPDEDEYFCAYLARDLGAVVVSVDYRLAPEDPFPAGFDDCYAVVEAVADGATGLGGRPIVIAGASAGAGLAAAVALRSRDEGGPALAGQLLLFPFLDATMSTASYKENADGPVFTAVDANNCWNHYLGDARQDPPPYASPSTHQDLSGLPRSYIVAAGADPLRDEAVDYALRLQAAGVSTDLQLVADVPHGFSALVPTAKASRRVRSAIVNAITQMLDNGRDSE